MSYIRSTNNSEALYIWDYITQFNITRTLKSKNFLSLTIN